MCHFAWIAPRNQPLTAGEISLHKFLERLARHPKLSRTSLLKEFLESSQWVRHACQAVWTAEMLTLTVA